MQKAYIVLYKTRKILSKMSQWLTRIMSDLSMVANNSFSHCIADGKLSSAPQEALLLKDNC